MNGGDGDKGADAEADKLALLVQRLMEAECALQEHLAGQVDAIVGQNGQTLLLEQAQQRLIESESVQRQAAELQTAILDAIPANIALVNAEGVILAVNESWRRFGAANAAEGDEFFVGRNYLEICDRTDGECAEDARAVAAGIRRVLRGEANEFNLEYPCHSPVEQRWYRVVATPLRPGRLTGAVVMHLNVTERKLAEQALAEGEGQQRRLALQLQAERSRLVAAQSVAKIGSWDTDLSTFAVLWSEETHHIFGTDPAVFTPTHEGFLRFVHPEDRAAVDAAFVRSLNEGGTHSIEHRIVSLGGRTKIVEERWQVFLDDEMKPVRAIGTCHDITERAIAQEHLRRTEAMARIAGRLAQVGAWSVDVASMLCTFSDEVCAIHAKPPGFAPKVDEAIRFYAPEFRPVIERAFQGCLREGTSFDLELQLMPVPGERVWVHSIGEAVRNVRGEIVGVQGALQDISERKRVERNNRALADRLVTTLETITDAFIMMDREFRFTYINREAERMLGRRREDLVSRTMASEFEGIAGSVFDQQYRRALEDNVPVEFEAYYPPLGKWFSVHGYPSPDGLSVYFRDVSEARQAREDLARTHRALQMLSRSNEALIRADSEQTLLEGICKIATEEGGYRMAWVGYAVDDEAKTIEPKASAGAGIEYVASLKLSWSEKMPNGLGPVGRSVRTGIPVLIEDVFADEYLRPWWPEIEKRGYRGLISLPLNDGAKTFGTLALYDAELRQMPADEIKLLGELANNLAFGITSLRSRIERRKTQDAVFAMARGLSAEAGTEFFRKLTLSLVEALGADIGCIAQLAGAEGKQAQTLALVVEGKHLDNVAYDLEGTPCEQVSSRSIWCVPREVRRLYPKASKLAEFETESYVGATLFDVAGRPIGLMFVQSRQPLTEESFACSTLQIFAARAAAELEREKVAVRTREQAALLDKAQDAIIVRDLTHCITFWNKSAERLYGWTAEEAIGRSVRDMLYFEPGSFDAAMRQLLEHGEWVGELNQLRKDGASLTIEGRWTLVRNDAGEAVSVLAINTDITERKKLEQQFLRAQRMESLGTLAGGIAHDLNNLLAPITMGVDLLKRYEPRPESQRVLSTIERSARRGADLVKQVLSFARGVEGSRVAVYLKHIIQEVEVIGQNTFPKNIRFEVKVARDLRLVQGDPTQLNQVLLNLCVNARDAMPTGGQLSITASNCDVDEQYAVMNRGVTAGSYVVIEVADTGEGMTREVQERIFEPFYTTKEVGKGTGLGLSTALGIVRSHGGFINVYSEPGRGSTFKVYLPAKTEAADHVASATVAAEAHPVGRGEVILVVDDETSILDITRETLETHGYVVLTAIDGAAAIGVYALHRDKIAAVVTDIMMPVMDGAALITALRRINPHVRIIAASGLSANAHLGRATGEGVKQFLAKPYSADAILGALRNVLDAEGTRSPLPGAHP